MLQQMRMHHAVPETLRVQEQGKTAALATAALQEERDVLLADADAKTARQMAMQDRISKLEVRSR